MHCLFITNRLDITTIRPVNAAKLWVTVRQRGPAYGRAREESSDLFDSVKICTNLSRSELKATYKMLLVSYTECLCFTERKKKPGLLRVKWVMVDDAGLYKALQDTPSYDRWGGNRHRRKKKDIEFFFFFKRKLGAINDSSRCKWQLEREQSGT